MEPADSPYPRPPQDEVPIVRTRQLGWALSCIIFYPIVSLLMPDESLSVAVAVASPFIIGYYSAAAFRNWTHRIVALLAVLCVCWLVTDSLLTLIAQNR